jgi:hypothetical protein
MFNANYFVSIKKIAPAFKITIFQAVVIYIYILLIGIVNLISVKIRCVSAAVGGTRIAKHKFRTQDKAKL